AAPTGGQPTSTATCQSRSSDVSAAGRASSCPPATPRTTRRTRRSAASTYTSHFRPSNSIANVEIRQSGTTYYNLPTVYYQFLFEYSCRRRHTGVLRDWGSDVCSNDVLHLSAADKLLFYDGSGTLRGTGSTVLQAGQVYVLSEIGRASGRERV